MFVQPEDLEVSLPDAERDMRPLPTSSEDLKCLCLEQHVVQPNKTVKRGQPVLVQRLILVVRTQMYRDRGASSML